jgi:soluble lytic murein transglycosylase-like protein
MVWQDEVEKAASHWGPYYGVAIDPALVHAIIERESGHGQAANYVKYRGVVPESGGHFSFGPMQVYDDTVRTVLKLGFPGADLASHPNLGIWYGTKYFAMLVKQFAGDTARAVAAYNAGPGNSSRNAAGKFVNQSYVDAVLGFWKRYKGAVASLVPALVLAAFVFWFLAARRRATA